MDGPPTSLQTSGTVSSRFVSSVELDEAKKRKEEEWKAAYERIGQEPPPMQEETEYDPRSLHERLQSQKEAKREAMDEKMSMKNQFKWLEEDDVAFLDDVAAEKNKAYREQQMKEEEELAAFKARQKGGYNIPPPSLPAAAAAASISSSKPTTARPTPKRDVKSLMKGLVKKKPMTKPATLSSTNGKKSEFETGVGGVVTAFDKASSDVPVPVQVDESKYKAQTAPKEEVKKRPLLLGDYSDSDEEGEGTGDGAAGDADKEPQGPDIKRAKTTEV